MVLARPLPQISISPAPPEVPLVEPFSPFSWESPLKEAEDDFRPKLLTPPPTGPRSGRPSSPLRPADAVPKGLDRERFEALLKATRERTSNGSKKTNDLRKEVALKAHKTKQVERRALFLSKVLAPPSPTATSLPKTPPESPAIFHYTLPSPGLVSPLALFESLNDKASTGPLSYALDPWVEQVDFRLPGPKRREQLPKVKSASSLPSLDQISARLNSQGHTRTPSFENSGRTTRLPAFLAQPRHTRPVGRLQLPLTAPRPESGQLMFPKSPRSPMSPALQVTTTLVPRTASQSPIELSESNLQALDSRERRAKDMLSTLRRRMVPTSDYGYNGHEEEDKDERKNRRHSAPADLLPLHPRKGFEHPILSLPGAF